MAEREISMDDDQALWQIHSELNALRMDMVKHAERGARAAALQAAAAVMASGSSMDIKDLLDRMTSYIATGAYDG